MVVATPESTNKGSACIIEISQKLTHPTSEVLRLHYNL